MVPIKFASRDHAELFVREHSRQKIVSNKHDGFWCNIRQSLEERERFKKYVEELFKAKRAICECLTFDGVRVVINKTDKKIFYVDGTEFKFICDMSSNGTMQWISEVVQEVRDRYAALIVSR